MAVETFVFFDIETTGLPQFEKNRTKITELAFVGVSRKDIETCTSLPLMNKLTYVFNPEKTIQVEAARMTGLSNTNLKNQATFKNRIESLNSFLEHFQKPVCLVAHNGNRFDFKILKSEYSDAGKELPHDLLCLDSMTGFRKIIKDTDISYKDKKRYSDTIVSQCSDNISVLNDDLLTDDEDWPALNTSAEDWNEIDKLTESFSNMSSSLDKGDCKKSSKKGDKVCYKLTELYKRFYNQNPLESHRAEADCIMLLQCVLATKQYFLPWADQNCKLIRDITPLVRK